MELKSTITKQTNKQISRGCNSRFEVAVETIHIYLKKGPSSLFSLQDREKKKEKEGKSNTILSSIGLHQEFHYKDYETFIRRETKGGQYFLNDKLFQIR